MSHGDGSAKVGSVLTIFEVAKKGDLEMLKKMMAQNKNLVYSLDGSGSTPLHYAARYGRAAFIQLLLATDEDILGAKNDSGMTAAHWAAKNAHPTMRKQCIETLKILAKILQMKDTSGSTVCHVAAAKGNRAAIDFFLARMPAILKEKDKDGRQATHLMASNGHLDLLQAVHAVNPGLLKETDGMRAGIAHYAAAGGQEAMLEFIHGCGSLDTPFLAQLDWTDNNAAHWAARGNKVNTLRFISIKQPLLLVQRNRDGLLPEDLAWDDVAKTFLERTIRDLKLEVPDKN